MKNFKGTFTALVTPFKNGKIDFASLDKLLKQQLAGGVDGFVVNGTTGESPVLTSSEKAELFKHIRNVCGDKVVLIMGTGSNNTAQTIEDSRKAEEMGADAILVVVPYYNKPPQRGLYEHFKAVASSVKIPTILYNVPGRTITSLETGTIRDLAKVKGVVGIKEATGKIDLASEIIKACGSEFVMLSGDDGTYVEFLGVGGHGVISVASHVIPAQMVQWKKWVSEGALDKARADIAKYNDLINLLFVEANPIPVKKALQLMGILESAELRLPLVELGAENTAKLQAEMKKVGVL
ncbi:4-hydroxy-tetrahydrodipicolinate synthase [Bdellovibrio bacteriovorus]|uniref:4-hydroxy-tetrahydrodipicolinate synthase n=1 Tax=Bdellovibrio bacteriovorus (strain ATCC 15356 / DSM 50701 / NCIMB 9529 / HD100) TaxID=264462 RepID=DAPA_BDEBA|nr:4-hydroxy-tetrahydrodipicolinate synthase [Bdellovibrio bacteriovorus]Q6MRM9.1 RecName: Full=4-hydroxy-tetrahydrodipicolinate synthase; Short=HTPA synthase [Bdellovibrio bacteriovorus HD100]CAE77728.1 dihydrodipicolinate synthase [Bdellovibrio bacteriovorus HD100]